MIYACISIIIYLPGEMNRPEYTPRQEAKGMKEIMTKPEILTVMYSLEALLETGNKDKALEVIKRVIDQVEEKKDKK